MIPTDAEATLEHARGEARDIVARGDGPATIHCATLKLPSGVKGERYFAMGAATRALFRDAVPVALVETMNSADGAR